MSAVAQDRLFEPEPPPRKPTREARWYWVVAPRPLFKLQMSTGFNAAYLEWHWARGLDPFAPKRTPIPGKLRQAVIERDGYVCGLCAGEVEADALHIDHVLPVACGGKNTLDNLQVAHAFCNISKGAKMAQELA